MKKQSIGKWPLVVLSIAVAVLVVAWIFLRSERGSAPDPSGSEARQTAVEGPGAPEIRSINVVVWEAVPDTVEETFTLPGTLEAWEERTLSLEQPGPVTWVGPGEGDRVRAGQEIMKIDTRALETQNARNQLELELKSRQFQRVSRLFEKQLVSQREYDLAKNDRDNAEANLEQSTIALEKSTLTSPIDGILEKLLIDQGEYGNVGMPAAVIVQVSRLKVLADVPEKDVSSIRAGQKVTVLPADLGAGGEVGREGTVIRVSYLADEATRTYATEIGIDNRGGILRPGMIVRVRYVRRLLKDVVVVPLYAVLDREGEKYVFVEEDNTAVLRQVRLGPVIDGRVVLFGGLQPGEHLIVKGQHLVGDGGPVHVVEETGEEG